jgi:periplasmic copper chaperone A
MKQFSEEFFKDHYYVYLLILTIFIASCSAKNNENLGLIIDEPYINLPLKGQMMSAGYFRLVNHSSNSVVLNTMICEGLDVSLHDSSVSEDGIMIMKSVQNILIEGGSALAFKPGSYHAMIVGLDEFVRTDKVQCSLVVNDTQSLPVVFELK